MTIYEKILPWTLFASILLHSTAVLVVFGIRQWQGLDRPAHLTQITLSRIVKEKPSTKITRAVTKPDPALDKSLVPYRSNVPLTMGKSKSASPVGLKMYERQTEKIKGMTVSRKISVPELYSEKINIPAYANYYQTVRDWIKKRADLICTQLEEGEVYLTFIVTADGKISQIKIIEEKTSANDYLRDVALRSAREASPFPTFPKDLKYPELTFNVVIRTL